MKIAMHRANIVEVQGSCPLQESLAIWDEIVYEAVPTGINRMLVVNDSPALSNSNQIEDQLIPLPSNGNVSQDYAQLELSHRISHANTHLSRIHDLITEKSFQYLHVICISPHKGVINNTHSRAAVKKLNLEISIHCRMYTQCWS